MTYAGYSWTYQSPFTLTGPYQDKTVYKTRNAALSACAATDKCLGVTKEAKKNFRLYTTNTAKKFKGRAVWIQGGPVVKAGGYNWAEYPKHSLSGYASKKVYKTRSKALRACGKMAGCKGVTKEGTNKFRLNSGTTLKPNKAATAYIQSSALIIYQDYYWTSVKGFNFDKHIKGKRYRKFARAAKVCTALSAKCVGISKTRRGVYLLASSTGLKSKPKGKVFVLGSSYEKEYFFINRGEKYINFPHMDKELCTLLS